MATTCTFYGLVGIQNPSRFQYDNKHFWKYDGYIALPDGDLAVAVFTFGANTASSEEGIYLMHARAMIGSGVTDEGTTTHTLHFYAIDELQPLDDGNRALPMLIVAGKVSRSNFALEQDHGFDIDISQYVFAPQQNIRVCCYYPQGHPRLSKTPLPSASKHVVVQGTILRIENERCILAVKDIAFGPSDNIVAGPTSDVVSSTPSKSFDWSGKKKQNAKSKDVADEKGKEKIKRGREDDEEHDVIPPSSSKAGSSKAGSSKAARS
ncbi:hypothetical protein P692DRAFT_20838257 [Suillus brevipes Sb2]|nr:hypothetical protein P692DRAFT_20838257 [Suillus brevipes Sb2]